MNEHAANARGNEFIGGRRSIERASERTEEGKFDRRAVRRAATSDYIYAYLMRVHNARNPCTTTRRLRAAQIAAAIPGLGRGEQPATALSPREDREREKRLGRCWNVDVFLFTPSSPLMLFIAAAIHLGSDAQHGGEKQRFVRNCCTRKFVNDREILPRWLKNFHARPSDEEISR